MVKWEDIKGKTVLVGALYVDAEGKETHNVQWFGVIETLTGKVLKIRLEDGTLATLPPTLEVFEKAPPGQYRLKCSGEMVENPDYLAAWVISNTPLEDSKG